jgi:2-polyprenyl-3-methyl-5-hydroxy-6-metoxy-1,4-benzoquinol methylase
MDIEKKIEALAPWWENLQINNYSTKDFSVGACRNKAMLFEKVFDKHYGKKLFQDKSVLDMGCNCGGSILEEINRGASFVKGLETNDRFFAQLEFVMENSGVLPSKYSIEQYNVCKNSYQLSVDLGSFDISMCIGLIYHLKKDSVIEIMKYLRENTNQVFFSSPIQSSPARQNLDWNVSKSGIDELLELSGFANKKVLLDVLPQDADFRWMTNTYYFEALK